MCPRRMRRFHKIRQTEPRPRSCSQGLAHRPGVACIEFVAQNRKRPHAQTSTLVADRPAVDGSRREILKVTSTGSLDCARDDGFLPNNAARAFFDELDQLRDLFARLDL